MQNDDIDEIENTQLEEDDGSRIEKVNNSKTTPNISSLIEQWKSSNLMIPDFQRKFVWTVKQSSRFIESLMLGLPIPSLMFYQDANGKQQVVDGQQRLKSILFFIGDISNKKLSKEEKTRFKFKLTGLSKESQFYNKAFSDFSPKEKNDLLYMISLDVNIITLPNPNDLTSIYYIFERLNTGGTPLTEQEIRNCIYDGKFNKFINRLNQYENWRKFFTDKRAMSHQKDTELILRFFALYDAEGQYKKPMKEFLSKYMGDPTVRNLDDSEIIKKEKLFKKVVDNIYYNLGERPFHITKGLNSSACDSIMIGFANNLNNIPTNISDKYKELCFNNDEFKEYIGKNANDANAVHKRIKLVDEILFNPIKRSPYKIIKLYDLPVSAGNGNWIGDDNVLFTDFPSDNPNVDFALKISGDSMESTIPNGSIVTVKHTDKISSGKIGIFTLNGEVLCKKYFYKNGVFLISENKKYKYIQIKPGDSFVVNGIVMEIFPPNI